ncbi:transporter substrate-binding domain-containing protein [Chromobacterium piscinae]|uniref:transporter substrate-binding domain-containing protein n=1 Tax=Chromobacterium piscinae TaxID=686831 RepID=UPI001E478B6B|nr:transporter substrate-binding domain-containing protein [Chromobacterium piscinae]MCD5328680.1 transporter substrate-binding domain-containing protein [Chromobacterium piscinae]
MAKLLRIGMLCLCCLCARAEGVSITYALVSGDSDPHWPYIQALLQLACSEMGQRCALLAARDMNQGRAMEQMQRPDSRVDLFWGMTSRERERKLLTVRIPLDKGLIGWRVPLINADRPQLLKSVKTLPQLAAFRAGQGQDWPDTQILQHAGLPVLTSPDYPNLFSMLRQHRYDYFPRSVIEVRQELDSPNSKGLMLDPYLLLHYPTAFYFFVSPQRPELARMLQQGLEKGVRDGSFEQLFKAFNGDHLRELKLSGRAIIELPNPLLPEATPLARRELWFHP